MNDTYAELTARLAEYEDLKRAREVLYWDQQTMMPPLGTRARAEQLGTLDRLAHATLASDEIARLLEALRPLEESLPFESDQASVIRVARRDHERARGVPAELRGELSHAGALGLEAWVDARARSDFSAFLPALRRNLELKRRYADCFDVEHPYDALLHDWEEGMTTPEVEAVFDRLKEELRPLVATAAKQADAVDDSFLRGRFPVDAQERLVLRILEHFGFTPDAFRLDPTVHPFETSFATTDIRLTTRYDEADIASGLFSCLHECGHGLYEHGVAPELERTPLGRQSMALHESQSRTWENLVGRSRPFWRTFLPELQDAFPEQLAGVDAEAFYRAVNKVQPSLIRVEADEVTYNFHVILRMELEQELFAGQLDPADLPEAWNDRMRRYLDVEVPDDASGVLQDVHWAENFWGYFPTYSLGNVISVQIWDEAARALPELDERIGPEELARLGTWLRENVYRHGRKYTSPQLLERLTGRTIDPAPYVRYLRAKVGEIYE